MNGFRISIRGQRYSIVVLAAKVSRFIPMSFKSIDFVRSVWLPMTDEAVEMVMERLEALKDGKGD